MGKGEERSCRRQLLVTDAGLCWDALYRCFRVRIFLRALCRSHQTPLRLPVSPGIAWSASTPLRAKRCSLQESVSKHWLSSSPFLRRGPYFTLWPRRPALRPHFSTEPPSPPPFPPQPTSPGATPPSLPVPRCRLQVPGEASSGLPELLHPPWGSVGPSKDPERGRGEAGTGQGPAGGRSRALPQAPCPGAGRHLAATPGPAAPGPRSGAAA